MFKNGDQVVVVSSVEDLAKDCVSNPEQYAGAVGEISNRITDSLENEPLYAVIFRSENGTRQWALRESELTLAGEDEETGPTEFPIPLADILIARSLKS